MMATSHVFLPSNGLCWHQLQKMEPYVYYFHCFLIIQPCYYFNSQVSCFRYASGKIKICLQFQSSNRTKNKKSVQLPFCRRLTTLIISFFSLRYCGFFCVNFLLFSHEIVLGQGSVMLNSLWRFITGAVESRTQTVDSSYQRRMVSSIWANTLEMHPDTSI